jgi:hypothetical protein
MMSIEEQAQLEEIKRHYGTVHFWQIPDFPVQFTHRGKVYNGIVKSWSDISRHDNDYDLCKVEVTESTHHAFTDWNNQRQVRTTTKQYIWPEPVQSYKLRKRLLKDED